MKDISIYIKKKRKTQNTLESKQKAKGHIRQGKTYKERALPHQLTMQLNY